MFTITKYPSPRLQVTINRHIERAPIVVGVLAIIVLFPQLSHAETSAVTSEMTLNIIFEDVKLLLASVIDKITTLAAFDYGWVFRFSPLSVASAFGAALTASCGLAAIVTAARSIF